MSFDFSKLLVDRGIVEELKDGDWVRKSFMVTGEEVNEVWNKKRFHSSADLKYIDTSLGGNHACNPKTSFTRYADPRRKGRRTHSVDDVSIYNKSWNIGLGQFYSEHVDDNTQLLYMGAGVATFSSFFNYLSMAVDQPTQVMAKKATGDKMYQIGKAFGVAATFRVNKLWGILVLSFATLEYSKKVLFGSTTAKYYWLKPAGHVYWNTVNNLVTRMAVEIGLVSIDLADPAPQRVGTPLTMNTEEIERINDIYGDILSSNGFIDARKIVNRANAMTRDQILRDVEMSKKGTVSVTDWMEYVKGPVDAGYEQPIEEHVKEVFTGKSLYKGTNNKPGAKEDTPAVDDVEDTDSLIDAAGGWISKLYDSHKAKQEDLILYTESAMRGGARWSTYSVEYMGKTTTTFSNSIKDIPTQDAMNKVGGGARAIEFSTAGANVIGVGIDKAIAGVMGFVQGMAHSATFGATDLLIGLFGGGFIEMPKMWDESVMSAQEYTFKMYLSSPYNHPMAAIHKKWIPFFMILAKSLPLMTGKASHTSPFLVEAFMRGILNIELGMVTSVTISHAEGNLGRDRNGTPLAIVVEFKVTDFSTMLAAPVSSYAHGTMVNTMDDSSAIGRFMTSLGGRSMNNSKYLGKKAGISFTRALASADIATDPSYLGNILGNFVAGLPLSSLLLDDMDLTRLSGA